MSDVAISIENLGKRYRYGGTAPLSHNLRSDIGDWVKGLLHRTNNQHATLHEVHEKHLDESPEYFWALKDVNLEIKQGEVVGIIGRNGAGKSTLLKILSRITPPTTGKITYHGRVASLLEVGTGFHRELTGRENIFLNGSILGMRRAEITRKFDDIVAFAEVEKFIDTPVKFYSSGMYVRLAFAVAAHLEPEILVVDEVLAVGDLAFQNKCLGKMEQVSSQGRTILFVSHNMQAVRALCPRAMLLQDGKVVHDGPAVETIACFNQAIRDVQVKADTAVNVAANRRGSGAVRFTSIRVLHNDGTESFNFKMGDTVRFVLSYQTFREVPELLVSVALRAGVSRDFVTSATHRISKSRVPSAQTDSVTIEFPDANLRPGEYQLYFWLGNSLAQPYDVVDDLTMPLTITTDKDIEELGFRPSDNVGFFSISSKLLNYREHS